MRYEHHNDLFQVFWVFEWDVCILAFLMRDRRFRIVVVGRVEMMVCHGGVIAHDQNR